MMYDTVEISVMTQFFLHALSSFMSCHCEDPQETLWKS